MVGWLDRDWELETREGSHHARPVRRSNNRKPEESPQNERLDEFERRKLLCGARRRDIIKVSRNILSQPVRRIEGGL
jgi:hypothetical protein